MRSERILRMSAGQAPEECVVREILEESGLSIQNPKFKGNDEYVFVFTATEFSGELIDAPEDELEWIPDEKVSSLNLWESGHIFLLWIPEGKFFSAKLEYERDEMHRFRVVFHP